MSELGDGRVEGKGTDIGRHVYGLGAVLCGILGLVWGEFVHWPPSKALGNVSHPEVLAYIAAVIVLLGGVAIQWARTARAGALALGVIYAVSALLWVPLIAGKPQVYQLWDNLF